MRAVNRYIIVDQIKENVKTASGILMGADDMIGIRYKKAKVVSPGDQVSTVKAGDVVYYDSTAGYTVVLEGSTHTVIQERDVVVVLD
jgi:co-chaperonin GroES (HSP10)